MTGRIAPFLSRRHFSAVAASCMVGTARAQASLVATPRQTAGPFYPVEWNGDVDNDLVVVRGEAARATGQVLHLRGRVLDVHGQPQAGARVEIWQCDFQGLYRHPGDQRSDRVRETAFQGRGRALAAADGLYSFRTIRPVAYANRTPHIHVRVETADRRSLVTQMYVEGEKLNSQDFLLNAIDAGRRQAVTVRLAAADDIETGALAGTFDIVID